MFQQEKREEDGKDSWVRLDAPKHSLDTVRHFFLFRRGWLICIIQSIMDVAWLNSNNQLGISCTDGSIRIFDYPSLKEVHMEQCHGGQCNTLDVHPRGKWVGVNEIEPLTNRLDSVILQPEEMTRFLLFGIRESGCVYGHVVLQSEFTWIW